jgi:multicomponent Na+:H+ antiporter subunit D
MSGSALPAATVGVSVLAAALIFPLGETKSVLRATLNLVAAVVKLALVGVMFWGFEHGRSYETRLGLLPDVELVLRVDPVSLLFVALSAVLWLITTVYAIGFLERGPHRSRFFGFFALAVATTMGIALAGNLLTFFIFYEALTLATYPLVVHSGSERALAAGRAYLAYTLGGGALLLAGTVALYALEGGAELAPGGTIAADADRTALIAIYALLVGGLAVKTAMIPVHAWLPQAMVAPTPVSALLHAVAVVKAGAYGIYRVTYDLYGIDLAADLGVLTPLLAVAAATIVWGSLQALRQSELKPLLAWSTVSQVSYITLGIGLFGPLGSIGALAHLVHQGLMKVTLFFCAGALDRTLGLKRIDELDGVGSRMPLTMGAFTVAALGMIGLPPVAGFVSKWYLGLGALEGSGWVLAVLVASTLLNAAYFLPILRRAWFAPRRRSARGDTDAPTKSAPGRWEAAPALLVPLLVTAALALAAGLFAGTGWSPLGIAESVTAEEYR